MYRLVLKLSLFFISLKKTINNVWDILSNQKIIVNIVENSLFAVLHMYFKMFFHLVVIYYSIPSVCFHFKSTEITESGFMGGKVKVMKYNEIAIKTLKQMYILYV